MEILLAIVLIGGLGAVFVSAFRSMGGSMASQAVRDRMTEAGSDIQKKREEDLGL